MVRKSGQPLSPCVEIDGVMLADISGEEVENYLLANNLVKATRRDQCCHQLPAAPTRNTTACRPSRCASSETKLSFDFSAKPDPDAVRLFYAMPSHVLASDPG